MIAIIDYGVGNLRSIENAVRFNNSSTAVEVVGAAEKLKKYSKIILPGVGAFGDAIEKIREKKFDEAIVEEVRKGKYLLGICLGMQLLATAGFEYGEHKGLDLIGGNVVNFKEITDNLSVPHIGWNEVKFLSDDRILEGIQNKSEFYFVHSYFFDCTNRADILGMTEYGVEFPSIVHRENIYGVQFHPEKSQQAGLNLINNFLKL